MSSQLRVTGKSNTTEAEFDIAAFIKEIDAIGGKLDFLEFEGGESLVSINKRMMRVSPSSVVTMIYVGLCLGFKVDKYINRPKLNNTIQGPIMNCGIFVPSKSSAVRRPGPGQIRLQQLLQAMPHITMKCMATVVEKAKDKLFSVDYGIPVEYCWPGSLVIYWPTKEMSPETVSKRIADYAEFIESYIAKRSQNSNSIRTECLNLINRSWMGKMIDAFSPDVILAWRTNERAVASVQPLITESKRMIAKLLTWNPWAQLPRPGNSQTFDKAYLDSLIQKIGQIAQ